VPSSPTPFTGYTITVPRDEVVDLPISVEEAIRFAVTAGVLIPDHQMVDSATESQGAVASHTREIHDANQDHKQAPAGHTGD